MLGTKPIPEFDYPLAYVYDVLRASLYLNSGLTPSLSFNSQECEVANLAGPRQQFESIEFDHIENSIRSVQKVAVDIGSLGLNHFHE